MELTGSPCKKCEFVEVDRGCEKCQACIKKPGGKIFELHQLMPRSIAEAKWSTLQSGINIGRHRPRLAAI